jgi:hypothetical protein
VTRVPRWEYCDGWRKDSEVEVSASTSTPQLYMSVPPMFHVSNARSRIASQMVPGTIATKRLLQ